MCPSKYEPPLKEPLCMDRRTRAFKAGSVDNVGRFGFGTHTPWEEFQNTIATRKYQRVLGGSAFPKRADHPDDDHWAQVLDKTEARLNPKQTFRKTVY